MLTLRSRKTAFAAAVVAAVSTPVSLASFPASAGDTEGKDPCASYYERYKQNPSAEAFGNEVACRIKIIRQQRQESRERTEAYRQDAAEARRAGEESERRTKVYNEQAAAAREQSADARKKIEEVKTVEACVDYLIDGMKSGIFSKKDILEKAGGLDKLKQGDTACVIAKRHFGYGKKAEAQPPLR